MLTLTRSNIHHMSLAPVSDDEVSHQVFILIDGDTIDRKAFLNVPAGEFRGEYKSFDGDDYTVTALMFGYLIEVPRRDTLDIIDWINQELKGGWPPYQGNRDEIYPSEVEFAIPRYDTGGVIIISTLNPHATKFVADNGVEYRMVADSHHHRIGMEVVVSNTQEYPTPDKWIEKNLPNLRQVVSDDDDTTSYTADTLSPLILLYN